MTNQGGQIQFEEFMDENSVLENDRKAGDDSADLNESKGNVGR